MMAMETTVDSKGVHIHDMKGTPQEQKELEKSYQHLCKLRDEVIEMGVLPKIEQWPSINHNLH